VSVSKLSIAAVSIGQARLGVVIVYFCSRCSRIVFVLIAVIIIVRIRGYSVWSVAHSLRDVTDNDSTPHSLDAAN